MSWGVFLDIQAAIIFAGTAIYVVARPPAESLRRVLLLVLIAALLWVLGDLGTLLARDLVTEQVSIAVLYTGSLGAPLLWWRLGLRFSATQGIRHSWITREIARIPTWIVGAVWLAAITNPLHGQFLTPVIGGKNEYHWMWWAGVPLVYAIGWAVLAVYVATWRRLPPRIHGRHQCVLMIIATLSVLTTNALYTLVDVPWPFDLTIFGGLLTGILFVGGVYSRELVAIPPFAMHELLQSDPTGLMLVDADGLLAYANPQACALLDAETLELGRPATEILASRLCPAVAPDRAVAPEEVAVLWKEAAAGALYRLRGATPPRWLWLTSEPLPPHGSDAGGYALRIRDVSALQTMAEEQRKLSERLQLAEGPRSTGVLTAGIAHEINNPLGSLLLGAQYAREARGDESDRETRLELAEEAFEAAVEETDRAHEILDDMLRFAVNEPGTRTQGDLNELVRRARERCEDAALRAGAHVRIHLEEPLPPVSLNAVEMEQVLVNLIHNAAESGGRGRQVEVTTEQSGGQVRVAVRDDGPGMAPEEAAHAFEPFHTSRRQQGGTGLGLSVVHGVVEAHGGQTRIESEIGRGTRVVIELPTAEG